MWVWRKALGPMIDAARMLACMLERMTQLLEPIDQQIRLTHFINTFD